jgi:hypothetical protein
MAAIYTTRKKDEETGVAEGARKLADELNAAAAKCVSIADDDASAYAALQAPSPLTPSHAHDHSLPLALPLFLTFNRLLGPRNVGGGDAPIRQIPTRRALCLRPIHAECARPNAGPPALHLRLCLHPSAPAPPWRRATITITAGFPDHRPHTHRAATAGWTR